MTIYAIFMISVLLIVTLISVPKRQVAHINDPVEKLNQENENRRTLAQIIGGFVVALGLIITYLTFKTNQEKQVTETFTDSISFFESNQQAVRIGGIYALERSALDADRRHHLVVMTILSEYAQQYGKWDPKNDNKNLERRKEILKRRKEIKLIFEIFKNRRFTDLQDENKHLFLEGLDLRGFDLTKINLKGARLAETHFEDFMKFTMSEIDSAYTIVDDPDSSEEEKFDAKKIIGSGIEKTNLSEANLEEANLWGTNFSFAKLKKANLNGSILTLSNLKDANLNGALLAKATINYALLDGADFTDADLRLANFEQSSLLQTKFGKADLQGAKFLEADIILADFRTAKGLDPGQIKNANGWQLAYFSDDFASELGLPLNHNNNLETANLNNYDLSGLIFPELNLRGAGLKNTKLYGANLTGIKELTQNQINQACTDQDTLLPGKLKLPKTDPCTSSKSN